MKAVSRRRLTRALSALDARARAVLALARLEGLDAAEIAGLLRATPEGVARDLASAERTLRRALAANPEGLLAERRRRA